jgi:pre-mRNA-splicing factor RBM22/SLT11
VLPKVLLKARADNGVNDPVARKLLVKAADLTNLSPPADDSITSLFLTNLPDSTTQELVKASLPEKEQQDIRSVVVVQASKCAFINFSTRAGAEAAALLYAAKGGIVQIGNEEQPGKVQWGRGKRTKATA